MANNKQEKYYRVTYDETSGYYKAMEKWLAAKEKTNEYVKQFLSSQGIESREYHAGNDSFHIVPTDADVDKLGTKISTVPSNPDEGLFPFKKNSSVHKAWLQFIIDNELDIIPFKPRPGMYLKYSGATQYRSFIADDTLLYVSIAGIGEIELPDGWTEIKGSEFHTVAEGLE